MCLAALLLREIQLFSKGLWQSLYILRELELWVVTRCLYAEMFYLLTLPGSCLLLLESGKGAVECASLFCRGPKCLCRNLVSPDSCFNIWVSELAFGYLVCVPNLFWFSEMGFKTVELQFATRLVTTKERSVYSLDQIVSLRKCLQAEWDPLLWEKCTKSAAWCALRSSGVFHGEGDAWKLTCVYNTQGLATE